MDAPEPWQARRIICPYCARHCLRFPDNKGFWRFMAQRVGNGVLSLFISSLCRFKSSCLSSAQKFMSQQCEQANPPWHPALGCRACSASSWLDLWSRDELWGVSVSSSAWLESLGSCGGKISRSNPWALQCWGRADWQVLTQIFRFLTWNQDLKSVFFKKNKMDLVLFTTFVSWSKPMSFPTEFLQ